VSGSPGPSIAQRSTCGRHAADVRQGAVGRLEHQDAQQLDSAAPTAKQNAHGRHSLDTCFQSNSCQTTTAITPTQKSIKGKGR
jgi:hypothetical protein